MALYIIIDGKIYPLMEVIELLRDNINQSKVSEMDEEGDKNSSSFDILGKY